MNDGDDTVTADGVKVDQPRRSMPVGALVAVAVMVVAAVGVGVAGSRSGAALEWWMLPPLLPFVGLVLAAECMDVRFRLKGHVEAFNLSEAVMAPLVFAFGGPAAMLAVAAGQILAGAFRRNAPVKVIFNAANWSLAAGLSAMTLAALAEGPGLSARNLGALLVAMVVMGVVNQIAIVTIIGIAQRSTVLEVLRNLSPVLVPGWVVAWALNTLIGFLFVFAYSASDFAALLFFVPLAVLRAAYRGYASTESDRIRLAGLHRASRLLATAAESDHAVAGFLAEVCRTFEAGAAELVLLEEDGIVIHSVRNADPSTYTRSTDAGADGLRSRLLAGHSTARVTSADEGELAVALRVAGWSDCLMTPLPANGSVVGALAVYDQDGLEGFEEGERAVLEALARETASSFEKGRLFTRLVQERSKLSQIVETTFDGVFTLDAHGIVQAWNPGWSHITGHSATTAVGRPLRSTITLLDLDGRDIDLGRWAQMIQELPTDMCLRSRDGDERFVHCTYRVEAGTDFDSAVLTVVAHDTTQKREVEQLKEDVDRLSELEALQRQRVLQLQESLQPDMPSTVEAEFGVHYLPSDTNAPTGGDFYDWKVLPDGEVHVAVVDVLGHGVEATNDAFAVIHTLRTLAFQGVPLKDLVRSADRILGSVNPELVATVMAVRYSPESGKALLAGGGHPPVLVSHTDGTVEEIAAPGIAIGWPGAGSEMAVEVDLRRGDTLILYTDGLIEADRDIVAGLEALARTASETRNLPAAELAQELVERSLEGASRRDDSLALVLRHAGAGKQNAASGTRLHHRAGAAHKEVAGFRHAFRAWAGEHGFDSELVDDMLIVVSELATNAVRAAHDYVELRAEVRDNNIVLEVEDDGPGFDSDGQLSTHASLEDEGGRGLDIVVSLVDSFEVIRSADSCTVRLVKACRTAGAAHVPFERTPALTGF